MIIRVCVCVYVCMLMQRLRHSAHENGFWISTLFSQAYITYADQASCTSTTTRASVQPHAHACMLMDTYWYTCADSIFACRYLNKHMHWRIHTHGHWRLHTRPHVLTTKTHTLSAQTPSEQGAKPAGNLRWAAWAAGRARRRRAWWGRARGGWPEHQTHVSVFEHARMITLLTSLLALATVVQCFIRKLFSFGNFPCMCVSLFVCACVSIWTCKCAVMKLRMMGWYVVVFSKKLLWGLFHA